MRVFLHLCLAAGFIVALLSCNGTTQTGKTASLPPAPDTVYPEDTMQPAITSEYKENIDPAIFEAAFVKGTLVDDRALDVAYTFEVLGLGKLKCPSGRIIACDPIQMENYAAFAQQFPSGEFPVQLAIAKDKGDAIGDVAFARIVFSDQPVAEWKPALHPGEKPLRLRDSTCYCYSVDAATGIFIDEESNKQFPVPSQGEWVRIFGTNMEPGGYRGYIYDFSSHNLAAFITGAGDGCYATYIGYDAEGKPCRLLTDFRIVRWRD